MAYLEGTEGHRRMVVGYRLLGRIGAQSILPVKYISQGLNRAVSMAGVTLSSFI